MEGTCNCGKITVKVNDPELYTRKRGHICHCFNCRKSSGSGKQAFAINLMIESTKVQIIGEDDLSIYHDGDSKSGNIVDRFFCRTCGNPIKSETEATRKAGNVILKEGIFDKIPEPEMEGFALARQPWVKRVDGCSQFITSFGTAKLE